MTLPPRTIAVRSPLGRRSLVAAAARWRVNRWSTGAIAAVALGFAGCYSPPYSQPYGQPYGQPAYPGTMQPGQQYYPGVAPGTTLGTPTYLDGGTPATGTGGDAPPFYGAPSSSTQNRPVPDYPDGSSSPYYPPGGTSSSGAANPSAFGTTAPPETEQWKEPIPGNASEISMTREVKAIVDQQYAYDTAGHRWLQGVVSYDPRDKSWGIVYSIDPQPDDPHAGYLTLVNDPRLAALRDGDVVRLDGQVDPARLDFSNRPSYAVQQITPISR